MAQLIDKSALVAEIEKNKNEIKQERDWHFDGYTHGYLCALKKVLSFINTLEVKEVDFEKEIDKWYNNEASEEFEYVLYEDIEKCAKHFFELGIKAQKL